ncbi:TadE family protein [Paenibacillus sp. YN15]|uniref:TadE family protein n=1 Tax=Paenibacillus sp. YN15 TaxID=1742774 RepID=UPI0015EBB8DE|nr:TadE family protein [Paenibacillus sp. YN15]
MIKQTEGSITVEAAIVLPAMVMFVLFMTSLIQIAAAEAALRSAVSETAKSAAAHWEPVRMVYREAKDQAMSTAPGQWAGSMADKLMDARAGWAEAEDWVLRYESLFPDMVGLLVQWEINKRESLEQQGINTVDAAVRKVTDPLLCRAFEPILRHYANGKLLKAERLSVEAVKLPSLEEGGDANMRITAGYALRLPVPFWNKTLYLEKTSVERAWVGEE